MDAHTAGIGPRRRPAAGQPGPSMPAPACTRHWAGARRRAARGGMRGASSPKARLQRGRCAGTGARFVTPPGASRGVGGPSGVGSRALRASAATLEETGPRARSVGAGAAHGGRRPCPRGRRAPSCDLRPRKCFERADIWRGAPGRAARLGTRGAPRRPGRRNRGKQARAAERGGARPARTPARATARPRTAGHSKGAAAAAGASGSLAARKRRGPRPRE
ncbi:MAG: hypothetical protein J3K34DRAFT_403294 [Monoraphidium minutum]|nr:MAG: hypothetical protein J3K34DRAFT_403294 [Monoraphidium minutum]